MPEYDLYQVTIYANTKDEYYTFTTPEAKRVYRCILAIQRGCGEKLTKDSPLFRQQFDGSDSLDVTHPKPLLRDGVITALDDALLQIWIKNSTLIDRRRLLSRKGNGKKLE